MARPVDYSKWDHIEISDDEDDTHPNIDTPSLFRWRHQARVDRMEEQRKEKEEIDREGKILQQKQQEIKNKLKESQETATEDLSKLKLEKGELDKQEEEFRRKEDEIQKKEKHTPWNIDTICHDGKDKTIINKQKPRIPDDELDEDQRFERMNNFIKKNKKSIEKFGMFKRYEDSEQFLTDNLHLVCEDTANHLVLWCINLQVEEKHDLMNHVSHQTIVMQFILELAKSLNVDPRSCVRAFFSRIKLAEKQYMEAFNDELHSFKQRVKTRAKARIQEAVEQYEQEERQKRLGPGGLDPVEVMESLPQEMQDCFDNKDIGQLQQVITNMDKKDAEYHMKRCVESGLWVPNAADLDKKPEPDDDDDDEEIYEEALEN